MLTMVTDLGEEGSGIDKINPLGSTRLKTAENGSVIYESNYAPFGPGIDEDGSEDYRYTGKYEDPSGLYYFGARFYDPLTGRFTTRDTFSGLRQAPQTQNPFVYCINNPNKYVDPSGHWLETAIDVASFGISFNDFWNDPTLWNLGMLVWDGASIVVPVMVGVGWIDNIDEGIDAARGASRIYDLAKLGQKIETYEDIIVKSSHLKHAKDMGFMRKTAVTVADDVAGWNKYLKNSKDTLYYLASRFGSDANIRLYHNLDHSTYNIVDESTGLIVAFSDGKIHTYFDDLYKLGNVREMFDLPGFIKNP